LFRHSIAHGIERKQSLLDTKLKMINDEEVDIGSVPFCDLSNF
jgi:hypothetical protein